MRTALLLFVCAALQAQPPLALMGGGTDLDEAFRWMIRKSGGGRFVVVRASGTDAYNGYLRGLGQVESVETLILRDRASALDPAVAAKIRGAAALFIAGGDQWNYVNFWKGTPVNEAIQRLAEKGAPIGGTSAGLAVLGEFLFPARNDTVRSAEALADPFHARVWLDRDFLRLPQLKGAITDTHLVERDRMGRLVAFLARILQDGWAKEARGIGVDRQTAVLVEPDGKASVVGHNTAYFLKTAALPERCQAGAPLTFRDVSVYRLTSGGTFDLRAWKGASGSAYTLHVEAGVLKSTQADGKVY